MLTRSVERTGGPADLEELDIESREAICAVRYGTTTSLVVSTLAALCVAFPWVFHKLQQLPELSTPGDHSSAKNYYDQAPVLKVASYLPTSFI